MRAHPRRSDQPDSKVCCTGTSIGTSLVPTIALPDNTYYWHVRALDAANDAGDWNDGQSFTKTFGRTPTRDVPIQNLHMADNVSDPGADADPATAGYQTHVPIVSWDPYPGASSYLVEVVPYQRGRCNWTESPTQRWASTTSTPAWTPLGVGWNGSKPYADPRAVATDTTGHPPGTPYC